jgi:Endonuclease/Exonuclease/phosphatase family
MRIISWNLAKENLVPIALEEINRDSDVGLFQEFNNQPEASIDGFLKFFACSFDTYGTAIYSRAPLVKTDLARSPKGDFRAKFWKGMVYKTTAIALIKNRDFPDGIIVVSFHGYNGTLQGRDPKDLANHVIEALNHVDSLAVTQLPCVFAGDFNTFETEHCVIVDQVMSRKGFRKAFGIPYQPGNDCRTLDWVYSRLCGVKLVKSDHHVSDHPYMLFDVIPV